MQTTVKQEPTDLDKLCQTFDALNVRYEKADDELIRKESAADEIASENPVLPPMTVNEYAEVRGADSDTAHAAAVVVEFSAAAFIFDSAGRFLGCGNVDDGFTTR